MKNIKLISEKSPISNLLSDILSDIFSLLPTKSILTCKFVCKLWCSIIRNPHFSMSFKSNALIFHRVGDRCYKKLHLVETQVDHAVRKRNGNLCLVLGKNSVIRFNDGGFDGFPAKMLDIVNSCKGLVCLTMSYLSFCGARNALYDGQREPYFVCNPVTSDYVVVKQLKSDGHFLKGYAGFGCSSKSGQYKLLRFFIRKRKNYAYSTIEAEVYTVGSDENWRRVDNLPPQGYDWCKKANFFEGALHWIILHRETSQGSIVAFDCHEEDFALLDLPDDLNHGCMNKYDQNMELAMLQSRLCFCIWNKIGRNDCDIWVMDEYGVRESWRKLFVISSGESPDCLMPFKPLAYLKNGEILMLSVKGELVSYDVRSNTWRAVKGPGVTAKVDTMLLDLSFVPTKNLLMQGEQANAMVTE